MNTDNIHPRHRFENSKRMANAIRVLAMDAVEKAQSGHPGMPMGMADIATILYTDYFKFNPKDPLWPNRDRLVLSNGHGSMLLYALSYLTGYQEMTIEQIKQFRQWGSITPGHPELHRSVGVETTTGPLGQGFANGVGMALAEKILAAEFGDDVVNHYTYVFCGDGCLMEGLSHEAASFAGHMGLGKLIVCFDDNSVTIDGATELATSEDHMERFEAYDWHVQSIDGHNHQQIFEALDRARNDPRPSFIACKTVIGYGAPNKGGQAETHGAPLGEVEIKEARKFLSWDESAFEVPQDIMDLWRTVPHRNEEVYNLWQEALQKLPEAMKEGYLRRLDGELPENWREPFYEQIRFFTDNKPTIATRESSGTVIESMDQHIPELIGGSADLSGSNFTKSKAARVITLNNFKGNYIHYGVREHGMAAIMNGMALHEGLIPFGGSFLTFTDYCRPAIRLSAMMQQRVIYVMTHDSIGLGEDGPTHQPIEQLASLRAIPNLYVFRPADAVEVAECWMLALHAKQHPSVLALSRQAVPTLRLDYLYGENMCRMGGYVMRTHDPSFGHIQVSLIATGSEVSLAIAAQKLLEEEKICTQVVSMPCWELFDLQDDDYREQVLGQNCLRIAIEAASPFGWERYVHSPQNVIGISTFGASAPYKEIYRHFGLTAENIVRHVKRQLEEKYNDN
jgi:transketolase